MHISPLQKSSFSNKTFYESKEQIKQKINELTIQKLQNKIELLENKINNLSKENSDLKTKIALNSNIEYELSNTQIKLRELEDKNYNLIENNYKEQKNLENKIENLNLLKEQEEKINRKSMIIYNQRRELLNQVELENKLNKEEIIILRKKNEDLKKKNEEKVKRLEIRNQIKYTELKKRMTDNLNEAKKNITKLNIEYMDVNNRLTLLQNNQLLNQIELQSEKIEELEKYNKNLKDQIFYLENELEIHKNVEIKLAKKIRKTSLSQNISFKDNTFNNFMNSNDSVNLNIELIKDQINPINKKVFCNSTTNKRTFNENNYFSIQEKKIQNLEKQIKNKNNEIENLKFIINDNKIKLSHYEDKYSGLFNFFENCLSQFYNDKEINKNKNFCINIDSIKKCNFSIFSKEEQYSLLVLIMKYLLPIINLNFNANCNVGNEIFQTNLNIINKEFNKTENFLNDPILKPAFIKYNKIKNHCSSNTNISNLFTKSIPIMRKDKIKHDIKISNFKLKGIIN